MILEQAMAAKAALVVDTRARHDLVPIAEHHSHGRHVATVHAFGPCEETDHPMPTSSLRLGAAGWHTDEVAVVAECYARPTGDDRVNAETRAGELAAVYANDPGTDVSEALQVAYARAGDRVATSLLVEYRYVETDAGLEVQWGRIVGPQPLTGTILASAVCDVLELADTDPTIRMWERIGRRDGGWPSKNTVAQLIFRTFGHAVVVVAR